MNISVVVPVYNGEITLEKLLIGIDENLKYKWTYEVIFVFDGGYERSWEILKRLNISYPMTVRIFKLGKNYGQHKATMFGITKSKGDLIITMDEDLQHDPQFICSLIEKHSDGKYNVVYGRFKDPQHSFERRLASKILRNILKYLIPGLGYYSSYRIIEKDIALKIADIHNSYAFIDAGLSRFTSNIGFVNIDHNKNYLRKSTYTILKLASHVIQIFLEYTRISKWLFVFSLGLFAVIILTKQFNKIGSDTQNWILGIGILFFIFGIMGEIFTKWKKSCKYFKIVAVESY